MITKRLFFQIPKRQKKISTELTVLGKQQSEEVASAKPQDTAHPKRRFLMLSDSTVGFILRFYSKGDPQACKSTQNLRN